MERYPDTIFSESLARRHAMGTFLDTFYEYFTCASPEVARLFERVDMERQISMLRGSLHLMIHAAGESHIASSHIIGLGRRHHSLGVRPDMYDWWLESLLQTVEECDPMFTPDIAAASRTVLGRGIAVMKACGREETDRN